MVGGSLIVIGVFGWVSVDYIEPLFRQTQGVSQSEAEGLTAFIDIAGIFPFALAIAGLGAYTAYKLYLDWCKPNASLRAAVDRDNFSVTLTNASLHGAPDVEDDSLGQSSTNFFKIEAPRHPQEPKRYQYVEIKV
jgi:hypothetical protein